MRSQALCVATCVLTKHLCIDAKNYHRVLVVQINETIIQHHDGSLTIKDSALATNTSYKMII